MRSPFALEKQRRAHVDKLLRDTFEKVHNEALAAVERRARFALRHAPMVVEKAVKKRAAKKPAKRRAKTK